MIKFIGVIIFTLCSVNHFALAKDAKTIVRKMSSAPTYPEKSVSKVDCLSNGGRANDGADGVNLLCEGGKFDKYTVINCDYVLDGQAYVGKDDGELKFYNKTYRCETYKIGDTVRNLCKTKNSKLKTFELVVAFDGAENDFFVFSGLDSSTELCHAVAKVKTRKK